MLGLVGLLALPALHAPAGQEAQVPPPTALQALDAATAAAVRGDWPGARDWLRQAAAGLAPLPRPADGPGAELNASLAAAEAAAQAMDAPALRVHVAAARAGAVHASLVLALEGLARGSVELGQLPQAFDLHRAGPELGLLVARVPREPGNATLQQRAAQRLVDRVAEAARVESLLAELAVRDGLPDEARAHGSAALGLARTLGGEAMALPAATSESWRRMLADWPGAVGAMDAEGTVRIGAELRPLLLALGLGRTLARLDTEGDAVLVAALAAEAKVLEQRAARSFNGTLLQEAAAAGLADTYAERRRALFLAGEGAIEPLDGDVTLLRERLGNASSSAALRSAVEDIRADLRSVAHLTFGAFARLEFVHVPRDRTVTLGFVAGRFPFDGVAAWEARVGFQPGTARPVGVQPEDFILAEAAWDNTTGVLALRGAASPPVEGDAVLARLAFHGVGLPKTESNLTFLHFNMTSGAGRDVELFLLRPGRVTISELDPGASNASEEPGPLEVTNPALKPRTPGPGALEGLALALVAAGLTRAAGRSRWQGRRPPRRGRQR